MKLSEAPESTRAKCESEESGEIDTSRRREGLEVVEVEDRREAYSKGNSSQGEGDRSRSRESSGSSTCFPKLPWSIRQRKLWRLADL
jgi:hypothetical protein